MKVSLVFLCVVAIAYAVNEHILEQMFGGLVQELGSYFRDKYDTHHIVTQSQCFADCKSHLSLEDGLCTDVCKLAGDKFPSVESQ